ncbi:hypothetical protein LL033_23990 [Clostridium estertheticum]|uniref:hypothetical protein n=1 Tax=Clostridium estertheticum TaxID=238834 RepID=UPI001C0D9212|nr:hypothetical protein [Clostridium estertheticum]MBU3215105.1 hypothetical protein [Clostridium estertheticum]WAG55605.1 hypothetical protein LL033_23990 [Clostridium estertheticum]
MSSNLNEPKVKVSIILAMVTCVVILVLTSGYSKNKVLVDNFHQNIKQSSANLNLKELAYQNGTFSFSKKVSIEEMKAQVIVSPKPIIKSKQIGYISNVYDKNGKRYLSFDDVNFLIRNDAIEAAKKDGNALYEDGKYYVYDDYYIFNNNKTIKNYVIANTASLNVLGFLINPLNNDINNQPTTYATFKRVSNSRNGHMLCYIYTQNDIVVKVEGQYTP